jgi:hypothetical protein
MWNFRGWGLGARGAENAIHPPIRVVTRLDEPIRSLGAQPRSFAATLAITPTATRGPAATG